MMWPLVLALPWGVLLLGDFEPFLASVQKALLSGTCLASSFHSGLDHISHVILRDAFLSLSVPSSCFIFLHSTYYHLPYIHLLYICLPLTRM